MLCNTQITAQGNDLPWAVLIHGLFGSGDNLNILARALAPHCNVIQIDLPDHGQSPWTDGFSFAHYCTMIVADTRPPQCNVCTFYRSLSWR